MERLILRGSRRSWLRYLAEVTELVTAAAAGPEPGDRATALLAGEVVLDHHRMLIGLPGTGYGHTAGDRTALESAVRTLRTPTPADPADPATPATPATSGIRTTRTAPDTARTVRTAPTAPTARTPRPGDSR